MAAWNPNSTGTKGLEWLAYSPSAYVLDSMTKQATMRLAQTVGQAIGTIRVYASAIPTRGGVYALEAYDGETAVPTSAVSTLTAQPNEDVSGTGAGAWQEDDGTTTTIYTEIDEVTLDLADYIKLAHNVATVPYVGRMNTAGLSLTGQRILAVRLRAVVGVSAPTMTVNAQLGLDIGGVAYDAPVHWTAPSIIDDTWYYNPATKLPWSIADVQAFDSTNEYRVTVGWSGSAFPGDQTYIFQALMEVVICNETRLAVGVLNDAESALTPNAWNAATMLTPTGGTWTKDGAGFHTYLLRRLTSTGALAVPVFGAGPLAPIAASFPSATLDPTYGYATAMGAAHQFVFPLIQRTTAPAESVDSQPYVAQVEALVFTGQDAEQEFSDAAVANYGQYRALVKHSGAPTADLLIKLKKRSDNSQLGTTVTVTKAQVDALTALPGAAAWKLLEVSAGTFGTLATGTQYYVEFSSGTSSGNPWIVLALDTADQGNGATFGGTTDRALVNGTEADRYDIAVTVASIPTTPTGFAAVVQQQAI